MIGVVILNYNTWDETLLCVNSIIKNTQGINYTIYLIDNASTVVASKDVMKQLKALSNVKIIFKEENDGYARGNNYGIQEAQKDGCKKILISNSDIIFENNVIYELNEFLRDNGDVGVAAPLLYQLNGKIQPISMLKKLTLRDKYRIILCKFVPELNKSEYIDQEIDEPLLVYAVAGACFMLDEKVLEIGNVFDPNTFLYYEEYILGTRLQNKNILSYVVPSAKCVHAHGVSTNKLKEFSYSCMVESEFYYCKKYLKCNNIALIPLFLIRMFSYIGRFGLQNISIFLKKIAKMEE